MNHLLRGAVKVVSVYCSYEHKLVTCIVNTARYLHTTLLYFLLTH
jgi:hypothetical protein